MIRWVNIAGAQCNGRHARQSQRPQEVRNNDILQSIEAKRHNCYKDKY